MISVHEAAKWFLYRAPMTRKKLQKLCYYAQAWYCAVYNSDGPLFPEEIQAWVHGPVIPSLFSLYADYRWNEIPSEDTMPVFESNVEKLLEAVFNTYGDYTGDQLEAITHSEDPWRNARGDLEPWQPSQNVITIPSLRAYYGARYDRSSD